MSDAAFAIDPAVVREWRRYPAYRDSGVEWLGEVPVGWQTKKLKYVSTVNDDVLSENTPPDYRFLYVDISNVDQTKGIQNPEEVIFEKSPSRARRMARSGDVIISTVRTYLRAITPIVDPPENLIVSTGFAVIRPNPNFDSTYAGYALRGSSFIETVVARSTGVSYPAINASTLISIGVPLPPLPEQHAIAAFLDRETARIDALVEKKRRLIDLLAEKRQALITRAVTKGLDPSVEMKDSGVEWLGEIPKHWEIMKGRFLYRQLDLPPRSSDGVVTAFRDGQVTLRENRRCDGFTIAIKEVGYQRVRKGDLVIHSMDGFAGAIGVSESDGKCTGEYVVCSPIQKCTNNHYFAACLRLMALRGYIHAFCPSVRQRAPRFRFVRFKDALLPVPPCHEQKEIMAHISESTKDFDDIIEKNSNIIQMLQEYRTALISAAVTGKIDVREEVPAEP